MEPLHDVEYISQLIIGGLGTLALLFLGYTINALRKSIDDLLSDMKRLESRVSRLEAQRESSLAFRDTIEVMFEKVQQQHEAVMREISEIKAWVKQKDQDILEFYKQFGNRLNDKSG